MKPLHRAILSTLPASHVHLCERLALPNERVATALAALTRAGKARRAADGWGWERVFRSTTPRPWTVAELQRLIEALPEERNYTEVGARVGRSAGSVQQRIARARKKSITPGAHAP